MRQADGPPYSVATSIAPDGEASALPAGALSAGPPETTHFAGREVPTAWRLRLPARGVDAEVRAFNPLAWNDTAFAYWKGPVTVTGSHEGCGYLETTGYE